MLKKKVFTFETFLALNFVKGHTRLEFSTTFAHFKLKIFFLLKGTDSTSIHPNSHTHKHTEEQLELVCIDAAVKMTKIDLRKKMSVESLFCESLIAKNSLYQETICTNER